MLMKNLGHLDPQISSNSIQLENLKKYEWIGYWGWDRLRESILHKNSIILYIYDTR